MCTHPLPSRAALYPALLFTSIVQALPTRRRRPLLRDVGWSTGAAMAWLSLFGALSAASAGALRGPPKDFRSKLWRCGAAYVALATLSAALWATLCCCSLLRQHSLRQQLQAQLRGDGAGAQVGLQPGFTLAMVMHITYPALAGWLCALCVGALCSCATTSLALLDEPPPPCLRPARATPRTQAPSAAVLASPLRCGSSHAFAADGGAWGAALIVLLGMGVIELVSARVGGSSLAAAFAWGMSAVCASCWESAPFAAFSAAVAGAAPPYPLIRTSCTRLDRTALPGCHMCHAAASSALCALGCPRRRRRAGLRSGDADTGLEP